MGSSNCPRKDKGCRDGGQPIPVKGGPQRNPSVCSRGDSGHNTRPIRTCEKVLSTSCLQYVLGAKSPIVG